VRAQKWAFARMSRHLQSRLGAGESFVSFIALFDGARPLPLFVHRSRPSPR
jgi:hypothetical protein